MYKIWYNGGHQSMEGMMEMSATTVIKDILDIKNMSQVELAEEINVTRQNLSNKMNRDKFSALELVEIADALGMNLVLKDKDIEQSILEYAEILKASGKSDESIQTYITCIREYYNWMMENHKEFIIDYPDEEKGKSKRNMTEEEKRIAQEKSMQTKARNAKLQEN